MSERAQRSGVPAVTASSHQEGGAGYGEGLFVQVGAAEEQQNVAMVFSFIKTECFCKLPQLVQVRRELQPGGAHMGSTLMSRSQFNSTLFIQGLLQSGLSLQTQSLPQPPPQTSNSGRKNSFLTG